MKLFKETTKKGEFLVEIGKGCDSKQFEQVYLASLDDNQRSMMVWDLFLNYHMMHGAETRATQT